MLTLDEKLYDRETIDGKPHGGLYFGKYIFIHGQSFSDPIAMKWAKDSLIRWQFDIFKKSLEVRHEEFIERPPYYAHDLGQYGTLGIKFMLWGRAWRVMRLNKKGIKRYSKVLVNGRRKYKRIDKV